MRMAISLRLAASNFLKGRIFPWLVPDFALRLFVKLIRTVGINVQPAKCKVLMAAAGRRWVAHARCAALTIMGWGRLNRQTPCPPRSAGPVNQAVAPESGEGPPHSRTLALCHSNASSKQRRVPRFT